MNAKSLLAAILFVSQPTDAAELLHHAQYGPDCGSLDNDQRSVNADWRSLKAEYPFTTNFMVSCVKSAKNQSDTTNCMAAACGMASAGASNNNEGCVDFGLELGRIATERDNLVKRRRLYPNCPATVPDETDG